MKWMKHLLGGTGVAFVMAATGAAYADNVQLINAWKGGYLGVQQGHLMQMTGPSAATVWTLEGAGTAGQYRIKSIANGGYLNIETGALSVGPVQDGWLSALWTVEQVDATHVRLANAWQPDQYINTETGKPVTSAIQSGWLSAEWSAKPVARGVAMAAPAATAAPGAMAPAAPAGKVHMIILNQSRAPIDLFVDDNTGTAQPVSTIPAGSGVDQLSPVGTIWRLAQGDKWVGAYQAGPAPRQRIDFPPAAN